MDIIPFLFGASVSMVVAPFLVERFLSPRQVRTKDIFPYASDYWTKRVLQLRDNRRGASEYRRISKKAYLDEYK
jgi:hypothetical protein